MTEPQNGRPLDGEPPATIIAAEMLRNLVLLNENIRKSHEIYETLAGSIADLCDYHETYMRAVEILIEKSEEGKSKFSVSDVVHAVAEAADEVMGEDGADEEGGEEVSARR